MLSGATSLVKAESLYAYYNVIYIIIQRINFLDMYGGGGRGVRVCVCVCVCVCERERERERESCRSYMSKTSSCALSCTV